MSFAAWTFLFGVLAVAGPVLAHFLARPRYKRVPFTMLKFLKMSTIESQSRRHLRDFLILLLRCVIIILIVFLFAQPVIFKNARPKQSHKIYYLGLDDSASMNYADGGDSYFEQMKNAAVEYIVTSESDSVFNICSLVSGGWNYGLNRQQALAEVQSLNIKSKRANFGAFISGLSSSVKEAKPNDRVSAYLISDFTGNILQQFFNCSEPAVVDNIDYKAISSSKLINNASIVNASADFKNNRLFIETIVNNNGQTQQKRKLYAIIDKENAASADIELNPGQTKVFPLVLNSSSVKNLNTFVPIELILTPGDNLNVDDKFYLAVQLPKEITRNVLMAEIEKDEMFLLETAVKTISEKSSSNKYNVRRIQIESLNASDLKWANIFMCPKIPDIQNNTIKAISDFIEKGGRAIFFLNDKPLSETAQTLFQQKVLPALPVKCIKEQAYMEISPGIEHISGIDNDALKALSNYRIDRMPLNGYWDCQGSPDSVSLLRYQNAAGFLYYRKKGNGSSILVNTSVDGSLGSLFKSSVSVALCQCLLGEQNKIFNSSFTCDEKINVPLENIETDEIGRKQIWMLNCTGQKQLASRSDNFITVPESDGTGWVQSIGEPAIYAGVNLPSGETNMSKPDSKEIENAISRIFTTGVSSLMARGLLSDSREINPESLVPILVWVLIALLLIESAAANRMKR
jgi:hypothetical protein